jgi:outer membrane protein
MEGTFMKVPMHYRSAHDLRFKSLAWVAALMSALALRSGEPQILPLTLKAALEQALAQNPQVHRSVLTLAQSQEDARAAQAALLPTLDAYGFIQRNKLNLDTFLGAPSRGGPAVVGPYGWGEVGIEARTTLFDLSVWNRWRAAHDFEAATRAQNRSVREGITALTVGQYFRALRGSESVKAAQSRVELAQALEKLAEDQQTHGIGTKLDTLRAQVQLQNERQRLIQAQTQLKTALYGLAKILDLEPGVSIELTDRLAAPDLPQFTYQEAYENGLVGRPELAALEAQQKAAENLRSAAQSARLPSVTLSGKYASVGLYPSEPWVPIFQVTLGVKVPLFTGGLVSSRIAKAKAELAKVQEERREMESMVNLEVQTSQAELDAAGSEVAVATQTTELASEALLQARHRFEAGVSNNIEVINAQDELAKASDSQINALYRLCQAYADLAKAMGRMETYFAR